MAKHRIYRNAMSRVLNSEEQRKLLGFYDFSFVSKLSFLPLIKYWKKRLTHNNAAETFLARKIIKRLDESLEFQMPILDDQVLVENWDFVELLISGVLPLAYHESQLALVVRPFSLNGFYQTPALKKMLDTTDMTLTINKDSALVRDTMIIRACCMILNAFYGQDIKVDLPIIFSAKFKEKETESHYKTELISDFVEIKKRRSLKPLSQKQINFLISNLHDLDLWLDCIPPENFEFHGLVRVNLIDVTEEEALSRLKRNLMEKDAVVTKDSVLNLERHLRVYFNKPRLKIGIIALDYPNKTGIPHRYSIRHNLLGAHQPGLLDTAFEGSVYEQACQLENTLVIEDLALLAAPGLIEESLLEAGFRSLIIVPLLDKKHHIIGLLELGAHEAYVLNNFTALKLDEVRPLFGTALQRSRVEIDNEIDAIIKEQYTSLHASVEWKFIEKSFELLQRRKKEGKKARIESIVFEEVYPLYGQADIINSSTTRNKLIQSDLVKNLELLKTLLQQIEAATSPGLVEKHLKQVEQDLGWLETGIGSSDEVRILTYLRQEINVFIEQMVMQYPALGEAAKTYLYQLDPQLGIVYDRRRAYEQSVELINDTISTYLEEQQAITQQMCPHYFEQFRTDGVEFDIYIGQSLLPNTRFQKVNLRNLRLWQLVAMCEITRRIDALKADLPIPLITAQLILIHNTPLAIRFRLDQKRFDVDGTYNVQYAIIKKRVDKALVKGRMERLRQAGKVAIVYAREADRLEYMAYLKFIRRQDLIDGEIEDLEIGELQGVKGLKALRFSVKMPNFEA